MGKKRKDRTPETAYPVGGESSSTSKTLNSTPPWQYDVFLSFAGKDTRLNFTDHLYEAFSRSGIRCFRDDVDLQRGEEIDTLFQAIQDSLCAVLVISKNYAKSTWCLDELKKILRCRKKLGRRVFPIFYNVDPADVRHQRKSFGKAFAKLEEKFKENTTKVQRWRTALSKISNFSGWVTRKKHEADIIKNIVGEVWSFLSPKLPFLEGNLVGIDSKVADVISFLEIWSDDKRSVGIWGMGGVGKTTLARVVFEKLKRSDQFEICCFLNVKDVLPIEGLVSLQKRLLSCLNIKDLKIDDPDHGRQMITSLLREKKVLLVIDDIGDHDKSQLDYLAQSANWFGKGSRILITTRDSHVLDLAEAGQRIYEMKAMEKDESLRLFSNEAFKKDQPEEGYWELSKSVVKYAGGLPLALKVLGSNFYGRRKVEWIDALDRLKKISDIGILQVLRISYDGLNEEDKIIFLDIACFFKGWCKKQVIQILRSCDLHPTIGIRHLIEKSLLVETKDCRLEMHDLIEELGRQMVHQESPKDVCKRSRLWNFKDIKEVLENNKGDGKIEAIVMKNKFSNEDKIEVHPEAFSKMNGLRLLLLNGSASIPKGLEKFFGALKFVRWPSFPLEDLPFPLDELVDIQMPYGKIKQLWNGKKSMNHLKFIDLRESQDLTETSEFSNVQSLGHLYLSRCKSLVKVHESLGVLKKLVDVNLRYCENLSSLPSKLETNFLRRLDLGFCKRIKKLPEFGESMKKLEYLDASYTGITTLPESLGSLTGLRQLYLRGTDLINLPTDCFSGLFELVLLSLRNCVWLESMPRLPQRLIRLEADGCFTMKRSLDEQLLNLVASFDPECRGQTKYVITDEEESMLLYPNESDCYSPFELKDVEPEDLPLRNFFAVMSFGGKIPSWFDSNIIYYGKARYKCEIEVDVPPHFCASKWSGIVVCLHLKGHNGVISWSSKAPEDENYSRRAERSYGIWRLDGDDGLCVMVLEFNQETCWKHLRDDKNSLHIQLLSLYDYNDMQTKSGICILGYGWRVICKNDIQKWCCPDHFNQFTQPQHAPPYEIKLPLEQLRRVFKISLKPHLRTRLELQQFI